MLLGVGLFFFYTLSIGVLPEKVNKKEFLTADVTDIGKKEKPHAKTRRRELVGTIISGFLRF